MIFFLRILVQILLLTVTIFLKWFQLCNTVRHWLFTCSQAYVNVHPLLHSSVRACTREHMWVSTFLMITFDKWSAFHHCLFTCSLAYVIVHPLLVVYAHVLVSTCEYLLIWLSLLTNNLLFITVYWHVLWRTCSYIHYLWLMYSWAHVNICVFGCHLLTNCLLFIIVCSYVL